MRKEGEEGVNDLVSQMVKIGNENGIPFGGEEPMQINLSAHISPDEYERVLKNIIDDRNCDIVSRPGQEKHNLQLLVVLKEQQDTVVYNTTKIVCDLQKGVVSQCLLSSKITNQRTRLDQYISNVLLKINAKLGGKMSRCMYRLQTSGVAENNPSFWNKPQIVS